MRDSTYEIGLDRQFIILVCVLLNHPLLCSLAPEGNYIMSSAGARTVEMGLCFRDCSEIVK